MPKLTDRFLAALKVEVGRKDRLVFDSEFRPGVGIRRPRRELGTSSSSGAMRQRAKVREPLHVWGNLTIDQAREAARVRLGAVPRGLTQKPSVFAGAPKPNGRVPRRR